MWKHTEKEVKILPGTYIANMTNRYTECTDGTRRSDSRDQIFGLAVVKETKNRKIRWLLDVNIPDLASPINCNPNGLGLECVISGMAKWPLCDQAPFTVTIDLDPANGWFIGTLVWVYRASCTNGRYGTCTLTANIRSL
jgi:hypothetical protein